MDVMAADDANPYESPQSVAAEPRPSVGKASVRAVIRALIMVLIGYVSFAGVGFFYFVVAEYFELEIFPSIRWALSIGGIGALIFLGSELFNSGNGKQAGFLRRFIVATGTIFVSAMISSTIGNALGWNPPRYRSQESDPYWIHGLVIFGIVSTVLLLAVRCLWIANRHTDGST